MSFQIPKKLLDNLEPGENIIDALKTTTLASRPDYTVLTDRRIIYFNDKYLGRYDMVVIPYPKLQHMEAERGLITYGKLLMKNESEEEISLNKVQKEQLEPFIESLEKAMNAVAVEPISIRRKKGIGSSMTWVFEKPAELVFRSRRDDFGGAPAPRAVDPLAELKMRYVRGEITEDEYLQKKRFLESPY